MFILLSSWFAHIVDMLRGDRGIISKYRNQEAPRSTRKVLVATQRRRNNVPTTTAIGHRHTGALSNRGKMMICEKDRPLK